MGSWLVPRSELTDEQIRAVELAPTENRLILGAPGSGKTLVLVYRACHLAQQYRSKPDRYRVFVFTKALREYIRAGAHDLGLPTECITTLASWCIAFYKAHVSSSLPRNADKETDYEAVTSGVLRYLKGLRQSSRMYDFVMVDEGQDLDRDEFSVLSLVANHMTVCMDHRQQIYERGADERTVLGQLGLRKHNMALLEAYRCCPYISQLASHFISGADERAAFLRQTRTEQVERETPVLFVARDWKEERDQLFDMVRLRQGNGERVAILVPQKRMAFGFAKGLAEEGLTVETQDRLDFGTDTPKIMPFHSAKGLTFDTVIMPRLVQGSFRRAKPDYVRRLMFVGITRATRWVYMSTVEYEELGALEPLLGGCAGGSLTIRRGQGAQAPATEPSPQLTKDPPDDLLDIL